MKRRILIAACLLLVAIAAFLFFAHKGKQHPAKQPSHPLQPRLKAPAAPLAPNVPKKILRPRLGGGTYTAASCNYSDVNAIINGPTHTAVDGDTIQIPSGSCTWTSGITVPSNIGITIIGAGTPNSGASTTGANSSCTATAITDNISGSPIFSMSPEYGNSTSRIACMNLLPGTSATSPIQVIGTCTSSGCPNLRFDNVTEPAGWAGIGISDDAANIVVNAYGVADHNTCGAGTSVDNGVDCFNISHASWLGVGSYGDKSWASPDTFGTASAFYIENNIIDNSLITDTDTNAGGGGGARWVCRFNTVNGMSTGGVCGDHGTDTTGRPRGGRQFEVYANTMQCTNSSQGCSGVAAGRSGTGFIWGNTVTVTGSAFFKTFTSLDSQRAWRADSPWNGCNGTSVWDTNDGGSTPTQYYSGTMGTISDNGGGWTIGDSGSPGWSVNQWAPTGAPYAFYDTTQGYGIMIDSSTSNSFTTVFLCESCISYRPATGDAYKIYRSTVCMDQPTRGAGVLLSGLTPSPSGPVNEALDPLYEMDDTQPGNYTSVSSIEGTMIDNRDFYQESPNQSAQTSPTSPFNGTVGTGHGTLANRPTTCTPSVGYWATDQGSWNTSGSPEGELFVCTSLNTWSLYYTPYTYPHPLDSGVNQVATPTFSPVGGTYSSAQTVTISTATGGATLCYTTDGSTPTANGAGTCTHGTTYSSPITVSTTQTVKAVGSLSGDTDSSVGSATYTISTPYTITVSVSGSGTVTSSPSGINCPGTCTDSSAVGTVTLTATPAGGNSFTGWSGACSGTGTCVVTGTASVTATFTAITCASPVTIGAYTNCGNFFVHGGDNIATLTASYSPVTGNGILIHLTWCSQSSPLCSAYVTTITPTISDNINSPETCFHASPNSPYYTGNTSVPDYVTGYAFYCPSIPAGVTSFTVTNSGTGSSGTTFLTMSGSEWQTGSIASSGYFETVDQGASSNNTPSLTASVPTSSTLAHANDLIPATISNCGGTFNIVAGAGYTALTINPSGNPGFVTEAAQASSSSVQTATASWSGTTTSGNCQLGQTGGLDTWYGLITPLISSAPTNSLTVAKAGTGSGTVSGTNCAVGTNVYSSGTSIVCTATPATGSGFGGWSGACTGTGSCSFPLNVSSTVTATFVPLTPTAPSALLVTSP